MSKETKIVDEKLEKPKSKEIDISNKNNQAKKFTYLRKVEFTAISGTRFIIVLAFLVIFLESSLFDYLVTVYASIYNPSYLQIVYVTYLIKTLVPLYVVFIFVLILLFSKFNWGPLKSDMLKYIVFFTIFVLVTNYFFASWITFYNLQAFNEVYMYIVKAMLPIIVSYWMCLLFTHERIKHLFSEKISIITWLLPIVSYLLPMIDLSSYLSISYHFFVLLVSEGDLTYLMESFYFIFLIIVIIAQAIIIFFLTRDEYPLDSRLSVQTTYAIALFYMLLLPITLNLNLTHVGFNISIGSIHYYYFFVVGIYTLMIVFFIFGVKHDQHIFLLYGGFIVLLALMYPFPPVLVAATIVFISFLAVIIPGLLTLLIIVGDFAVVYYYFTQTTFLQEANLNTILSLWDVSGLMIISIIGLQIVALEGRVVSVEREILKKTKFRKLEGIAGLDSYLFNLKSRIPDVEERLSGAYIRKTATIMLTRLLISFLYVTGLFAMTILFASAIIRMYPSFGYIEALYTPEFTVLPFGLFVILLVLTLRYRPLTEEVEK
ncbi:MAG: hypothetical protein ACP6IU_09920 [Candidatus Asgardarchaeia archaeon]